MKDRVKTGSAIKRGAGRWLLCGNIQFVNIGGVVGDAKDMPQTDQDHFAMIEKITPKVRNN